MVRPLNLACMDSVPGTRRPNPTLRSMPVALYLYVLQLTVQVGVWAWGDMHKCQGLIKKKYNCY